jgi:tetratricopeptide (TPR) repeat protein
LRTFFLFYLLSWFLRSPLLALLIVGVVFYFSEARYHGRYFNPAKMFNKRNAIRDLRHTLALNDHDVGAHNDLGRLLLEDGKIDEAAAHLEKAIKRMDDSAETNYYHGLCLLKRGRGEEGEGFIGRALEISPRLLYGNPQVVLARHHHEQGRPEQALEWARQAVKLNTSNVEGWVLVGEACRALGKDEQAREAFVHAAEAYDHLPHYLKLASRKWRGEAKRALKAQT